MAWFGDGLPSLSNLKGQITTFTKGVLSEGIVEEIDERSQALNEANERCVQLQELLNAKDAEISLLRRQNCELQKVVMELNAKQKDPNDTNQDDDSEVFFWDPPSVKNRNPKNQNQEQLAQAAVKIRELEAELKRTQKVNSTSLKDDIPEGHQKAEFLRAKQDMVNRIIQMEEKTREAERNTKRMQLDETTLINDFRTVISKLNSLEKLDLVRSALKALESEETDKREKSDFDKKFNDFDVNSDHKRNDGFVEPSSNRETELYKKLEELQDENKNLFSSIEELDQQHAESIEKLLSLKEEVEKKHQCLQNAYEQLYVEFNESQNKVTELQSKVVSVESHKSPSEVVDRSLQTSRNVEKEEKGVQTDATETVEEERISLETNAIDDLTRRIKDILKNSCIDIEQEESIFEAVAKQYVDVKWKKDMLERKVTELTRDLKESVEMKEALQMECDDMQSHIDSLLLEVQDLKLNLPSIPEASEERVASLETETESLHEEIKRLQEENDAVRKKNSDLIAVVQNVTLKSEDDLEDKDKNERINESFKEETENNEITDLRSKLETSLEENEELRKRIDLLENTERQMQDQLRMSLEKCKGLDENIELIEEIKLDLENVKRELKVSISNSKRLESTVADLQRVKDEIEKENALLLKAKEQLEGELLKWREIDLRKDYDEALQNFQNQFMRVNQEKEELQYNAMSLRRELDKALSQVDLKQCQVTKLSQDNERLAKENNSLLEQLTAAHNESSEKVELVNTEMSLLQQECDELKQEAAAAQREISDAKKRLQETEEEYFKLKNDFGDLSSKSEQLRLENKAFHVNIRKIEEFAKKFHCETSIGEETNDTDNLKDITIDEILKSLEEKLLVAEERCLRLESEIISLQDKQEPVKNNEKQQIIAILEEKTRENESLKTSNSQLMTQIIETKNGLQSVIENRKESAAMAKETIESLSNLIKEKDNEINALKTDISSKNVSLEFSNEFATIKNERDELMKLVTIKHNESLQYHTEIQRLTQLLSDQTAQIQVLASENTTNSERLKEKGTELLWVQNELQVAQQRLKNIEESRSSKETCDIVEHSTQTAEISILNEKCNALEAALIQEQSNNRMLQNQLVESQNKEANAGKELERLRAHLVQMESNYTEEALLAEETRNDLEAKLQQAEEKVKNSSTVYTSASIRANQQVETLQQQMALIIQHRDDIQNKLSAAEDKILLQTASLTNLQIVLEQFQQDKERDIIVATEKLQLQLNESYKKQEELANDVLNLKDQLAEAKECLQAASRLSEQLDKKTERIEQLNQEVERLTVLVNTADQRVDEAKQSGEGKVDKALIRNLLLGYLSSSAADKSSVLKVFATVLDFSETDRNKAGLNNATASNSWFSRLSGSAGAEPTKDQEASLTAAFVRFLESESKPKPQLPALPIATSPLSRPGHSRQHSTSSTNSTLLLSNVTLPTFPDFVPARNTGSILKEVLKDS